MRYDPEKHHRRSIRLRGYDYSQAGAYFVTICIQNRECLFGEIVDGEMRLNDVGRMVLSVWAELPRHYEGVDIDGFVAMPNHIHGIIVLVGGDVVVGAGFKPAPTIKRHGLPEVVRAFKTFSSRHINQSRGTPGRPVWQRNYYGQAIRSEEEMTGIRRYIEENPLMWQMDRENPAAQVEGTGEEACPGRDHIRSRAPIYRELAGCREARLDLPTLQKSFSRARCEEYWEAAVDEDILSVKAVEIRGFDPRWWLEPLAVPLLWSAFKA
jgi:REP element-mobilizing transposase RayT